MRPKNNRMEYKGKSYATSTFIGLLTILACSLLITAQETKTDGLLRTTENLNVNVTLSANDSYSYLMFWVEFPNTTLNLMFYSNKSRNYDIKVNRTGIWHIATISQPSETSKLFSLKIPSCQRYLYFDEQRTDVITLSSNKLVYWIVCNNIYSCSLLPPPAKTAPGTGYELYILVFMSAFCAVLIVVLVGLGVYVYRRLHFDHHYEKAKWPPLPPPLPSPMSLPPSPGIEGQISNNNNKNGHLERIKSPHEDLSDGELCEAPRQQIREEQSWDNMTTDPRAIIVDHESINSIYGMVIR